MVVPPWEGTRPVTIISTCMRPEGTPCFVRNEVEVTADERANGIHYLQAEARLVREGYEEPWVHFDQWKAPFFLIPALKQAVADALKAPDLITDTPWEDR